MTFLLLYHDHPCKVCKQLLLLLLFVVLVWHKCDGHRVSIKRDASYMQGSMYLSAENAPSPVQSYHVQAKMLGSGAHRTILITGVLLLLLVCSLGMHFMIKYALMCRRRAETMEGTATSRQAGEGKIELGLLPVAVYCKLPCQPAAAAPLVLSPAVACLALPLKDCQCAICLSDFRHGEKIRVLPRCGHGFHVSCIDAWLAAHASCPTCRFDLCTLAGLRSEKIGKPDLSGFSLNPLFQW